MHRPAHHRKGQSLVVVALSMMALISLIALAFDGGSALLQRRLMQTGADAAALAGIALMQENLTVSCDPQPCHPAYLLTNQVVAERITQLALANRGGTVGTATYSLLAEYHIMVGAPTGADTYRPVTEYSGAALIPAFVDGLRVTAGVANPTTFAGAINIATIPVSAAAAARLYGTCAPPELAGDAVPLVRFRPALEDALRGTLGNDVCHLFEFWNAQGDFAPAGSVASLNVYSLHAQGAPQTLAGFDMRNGSSGGLANYGSPIACPPACADMRGSAAGSGPGAIQDVQNWLFYPWRGQLSLTRSYPAASGTWGPTNRTIQGSGNTARPGDWIEPYTSGNWGANITNPLYEAALGGTDTPGISPPPGQGGLGWGPGVERLVYLWGPAALALGATTTDYAQEWQSRVRIPNCAQGACTYTGWEDLLLTSQGGVPQPTYAATSAWHPGAVAVDRVRLTRAIKVRFYANLQGNHGGAPQPPPGCTLPPIGSNRAWGLILSPSVAGPGEADNCGWQPGGAVYSRLIDP